MSNQRAQIFIMTLLVMLIALSLGAAFLFYARSFRAITRVQVDTDRAYSLARSGLERGVYWVENDSPCNSTWIRWTTNASFASLGGGAYYVDIRRSAPSSNIATITSLGWLGRSPRYIQDTADVPAAGWAKRYTISSTYTPDIRMRVTSDGGYIIGGGYQEYRLIKTDSNGNIQWSARYSGSGAFDNTGGSANSQTSSLWQDANGAYIIGSNRLYAGPTSDFLLIKTNSTGDLLWAVTYDSGVGAVPGAIDKLYTVSEISEGADRFYIAGGLGGIGEGQFFMIKTDTNWSVGPPNTWARHYGHIGISSSKDTLKVIRHTPPAVGGYILGGESIFLSADPKFMLVKIMADGSVEWAYRYEWGSTNEHFFRDLLALGDGYIFGGSYSVGVIENMFVIRTDLSGGVGPPGTWARIYFTGGSSLTHMDSLAQTNDGGFVLGGYYIPPDGIARKYALLIRIRADGTIVWARRYGNPSSILGDQITSVYVTGDGGYILGGRIDDNYTIVKTDPLGNAVCCTIDSDVTSSISVSNVTGDASFSWTTTTTNIFWSTGPVSLRVNSTSISRSSTSVNFSIICP